MRTQRRVAPRAGRARAWGARAIVATCVALGATALAQATASASSVSAVTFTGSSPYGNLSDTWTVDFTVTSALASGDSITVAFPSGFAVAASPPITLGNGFSSCTATGKGSSGQVVVSLSGTSCALAAGAAASLSFAVTNPPAPQTYITSAFTVATSQDTSPQSATSAPNSITGQSTSVIVGTFGPVSGEDYGNETGTSWVFGFTPNAPLVAGDTITLGFAPGMPSLPTTAVPSAVTGFGTCALSENTPTTAHSITFALGSGCSLAAGAIGSFQVAGFTNPPYGPATGGNTDYSITTSEDLSSGNPISTPAIVPSGTQSGDSNGDAITIDTLGPNDPYGGAATTWGLSFTPSSDGALKPGDEVNLVYPSTMDVPSGESANLAGGFSGTCVATLTTGSSGTAGEMIASVTVPTGCSLAGSIPAGVTFAATNPPARVYLPGQFAAFTTEDTTSPAISPAVKIDANFTLTTEDSTNLSTTTGTYGDTVAVTLQDSTDSPAPTGSVQLLYRIHGTTAWTALCGPQTLSGGEVQCSLTTLAAGVYDFAYSYSGGGMYPPVTDAAVGSPFSVNQQLLTVTVGNAVIVAGSTYSPTITVTGTVNGDTATYAPTSLCYAPSGSGTICPSTTTPTAPGTYTVTPDTGTMTISPAADSSDYMTAIIAASGTLTVVAPPPPLSASGGSGGSTAQVTLSVSIPSAQGTVGSSVDLSTAGGSGTGAVTFSVVGGTATGCAITGTTLTATGPGTCVVEATKAGDATYAGATSAPVTITFGAAKVVRHHPIAVPHPVTVAFAAGTSALGPAARRALIDLVKHLHPGATVTVTTWGDPRSLAIARARAIDAFLTHYRHLHVRVVAVVSAINRVRVVTTTQ